MPKHYRKLTVVLASDDDLTRPKYRIEELTEYSESQCDLVAGQGPKTLAASAVWSLALPVTPVKVLIVQVTGSVEVRLNGVGPGDGFKVEHVGTVGESSFNYGFLYLSSTNVTEIEIENLSGTETAEVEIGFGG